MRRAARCRGPDGREDAGADDRADAERGQLDRAERALQPRLPVLRFADQPIERLHPE
jgi:hypothetical protein